MKRLCNSSWTDVKQTRLQDSHTCKSGGGCWVTNSYRKEIIFEYLRLVNLAQDIFQWVGGLNIVINH
jgi:hypothetical protein